MSHFKALLKTAWGIFDAHTDGVYLHCMNEHHLTPDNFDRGLRNTLRFQHGFQHADLERAKGIVSDAIEHIEHKTGTSSGMGAHHLDTAMKFLNKDHAEWKKLPEHQKQHIEEALKEHFGITGPEKDVT